MPSSLLPLSPNILNILPITSLILSSKLPNFFKAVKIPPPTKPAKISPNDTCSFIQPKTLPITSPIFEAAFETQLHIDSNTSPNFLIPFDAPSKILGIPPKTFDIPSAILDNIPEIVEKNSLVLAPLSKVVKKSPITAITSNRESAKFPNPLD